MTNTTADHTTGAPEATMHLEYLYGPQWREVAQLIERAGQLRADEREKLNSAASNMMQASMSQLTGDGSAEGGLAGLLAGLGFGQQTGQPSTPQPLQIATEIAKSFGRSRNLQIAGMVAGQAVAPGASGTTMGDLNGIFQSLGSLGALTVVNQAVTATVLSDVVGTGAFTQEVYDELMRPWVTSIG